jgi:hypothetical protein
MSGVSHAAVTQISLRTTGTACNPVDNSAGEAYDAGWSRNEWGLSNSSGTQKLVVCPVVSSTGVGALPSLLRVNVWDRNPNQSVDCWLYRIDSNGKTLISSLGSGAGTNQSPQYLLSLGTNGAAQSTLSLICNVPASTGFGVSGIASIEMVYQSQ